MKLVLAVVQNKDSAKLSQALVKQGIRATRLASTGGFLRTGNTTFLIGVDDRQVDEVLRLIREHCHARQQVMTSMSSATAHLGTDLPFPVEVQVGGATVFVLDVNAYYHF
ncbi:MAG: hypothetical protein BAA01_14875 [Bacillus thermozeamaize]|uniref:Transcriptional regulator n=1 Tax=Bacillus thermozeamaize TaxID=230954 RepID=A0A1Y3PDC9_9BACI|nr:MAG: hypothetical protein BAA01_14875 [Bacillus thermozeamaize]